MPLLQEWEEDCINMFTLAVTGFLVLAYNKAVFSDYIADTSGKLPCDRNSCNCWCMAEKCSAVGNLNTTELTYNFHLGTGTCKAITIVKVLKEIANVTVFWSCSALWCKEMTVKSPN